MAIKKKKEEYKAGQQYGGTGIMEPPKMPEAALTNPTIQEEQQKGINLPVGNIPVTDITPKPSLEDTGNVKENPNMYKGIDISKSFSNTDFATKEDYVQAKRRAELLVNPDAFHVAQAQQLQQQQQAAQAQAFMQQNPIISPQMMAMQEQGGLLGPSLMAGAGKVVTSGPLVGAGVGAALGSAFAPGVGTAIGAVVGAFLSGMTTKIKQEKNEKIAIEYKTMTYSMKSMNQLISYVNKGGPDREGAWMQFQQNLAAIDEAQRNLKFEADKDINKFLSVDASKEIGNIQTFNELLRQNYIARMQMAMLSPNPNAPTDYLDFTDLPTGTSSENSMEDLGL